MAALGHGTVLPPIPAGSESNLVAWAATYHRVHLDLGTGDGACAIDLARRHPDTAVIGVDINLDRLRGAPKRRPGNLRFAAADALTIPTATLPAATAVTITFPYGSLLRGLVEGDDRLVERLDAWTRPGGRIAVRVNASALAAVGYVPEIAPASIADALLRVPGLVCRVDGLGRDELRAFPSQWSKRLGYGRPTSAWIIAGTRRAAIREGR